MISRISCNDPFASEKDLTAFKTGFPECLVGKVSRVIKTIQLNGSLFNNISNECVHDYYSWLEKYYLSDRNKVFFPYRMYFKECENFYSKLSDIEEKLIYDCIYTRNCDGYIREKHVKSILSSKVLPEWCMPYILRLSSEYVVEIIEIIYQGMQEKNNAAFTEFCRNNPIMLKRSYTRMVSYWNEFYRPDFRKFKNYVGRKLYHEIFSPNTNFEKL